MAVRGEADVVKIDVGAPDFKAINRGFEQDIGRSLKSAMAEGTQLLKADLREDVVDAGLGQKLAMTWQAKVYPAAAGSLDPAGWVWSKAPKLIDVFQRGTTIRSKDGFWLAIPTPAAGSVTGYRDAAGKRTRITPGAWERRTGIRLRLIYRRGKRTSFLVADNARINAKGVAAPNYGTSKRGGRYARLQGRVTSIIFILVPQVTLRKRLNSDAIVERAAARIPALIAKHWN
jgi:hypothetical protein